MGNVGPFRSVSPSLCGACGAVLEAGTSMNGTDARPCEGDLGICLACGVPGTFKAGPEDTLMHTTMTNEELQALDPVATATLLLHVAKAAALRAHLEAAGVLDLGKEKDKCSSKH